MTPEKTLELRRERWEKFKVHFIPAVIQKLLDSELAKRAKNGNVLTFPVDADDWLMVCWVPIFYYSFGFDQKDDAEVPAYIEATSKIHINGVAIGPRVTLRIIPPKNVGGEFKFPDLAETIETILKSRELVVNEEAYTVSTIMADPTAPPSETETMALVERLVSALVEMGFSRRGAVYKAQQAATAHPDIDNVDKLLELIIEGD